jgi:hypothetical protein
MLRFASAWCREAKRRREIGKARLPWDELEAEARRQGCSPADIFFDRAGHGCVPGAVAGGSRDARGRGQAARPTRDAGPGVAGGGGVR